MLVGGIFADVAAGSPIIPSNTETDSGSLSTSTPSQSKITSVGRSSPHPRRWLQRPAGESRVARQRGARAILPTAASRRVQSASTEWRGDGRLSPKMSSKARQAAGIVLRRLQGGRLQLSRLGVVGSITGPLSVVPKQ